MCLSYFFRKIALWTPCWALLQVSLSTFFLGWKMCAASIVRTSGVRCDNKLVSSPAVRLQYCSMLPALAPLLRSFVLCESFSIRTVFVISLSLLTMHTLPTVFAHWYVHCPHLSHLGEVSHSANLFTFALFFVVSHSLSTTHTLSTFMALWNVFLSAPALLWRGFALCEFSSIRIVLALCCILFTYHASLPTVFALWFVTLLPLVFLSVSPNEPWFEPDQEAPSQIKPMFPRPRVASLIVNTIKGK